MLAVRNLRVNAGDRDTGSIPGSRRPWRSAWQPTPVFLPGESNGQRSLAGYSPWGCKESDAFERLMLTHSVTLLKPMSVFLTSIFHVSSTV